MTQLKILVIIHPKESLILVIKFIISQQPPKSSTKIHNLDSMSSQNHGKQYQEISFNNTIQDQETNHSNIDSFDTQNTLKDKSSQSLALRIKQLQAQLTKQKQKSSQLEKRNQQLTDMLVSASQSSVKRNQNFIKEVQRKICNFKALKDLSSSSFRGIKQSQEKDLSTRMLTETGNENSRKLSITNRQNNSSRTKFDSNKENSNYLNERMKTQTDKFSKSKYTNQDLATSQFNPKEKSSLRNFESQTSMCGKYGKSHNLEGSKIDLVIKNSILSPFTKNLDVKTFNKLQHKLMRM